MVASTEPSAQLGLYARRRASADGADVRQVLKRAAAWEAGAPPLLSRRGGSQGGAAGSRLSKTVEKKLSDAAAVLS
eukprot:739086-Prymnesium_polylepis.1